MELKLRALEQNDSNGKSYFWKSFAVANKLFPRWRKSVLWIWNIIRDHWKVWNPRIFDLKYEIQPRNCWGILKKEHCIWFVRQRQQSNANKITDFFGEVARGRRNKGIWRVSGNLYFFSIPCNPYLSSRSQQ